MLRWILLSLIVVFTAGEGCLAVQSSYSDSNSNEQSYTYHRHHKKKKHHKKKHKHKKSKKKEKLYSAQKIEQTLNSDPQDGLCNRINCSSKLEVAKSCLKTRADHRRHKECFHAFCAYGCNDEDYTTKVDVHEFCNKTCSSKRYKIYN